VNHPQFGWIAFDGNIKMKANAVTVIPLDSFRSRIYLASIGFWLTLDAGEFDSVELNPHSGVVRVGLAAVSEFVSNARLRIEQPGDAETGI
jgi:hypothetical protein